MKRIGEAFAIRLAVVALATISILVNSGSVRAQDTKSKHESSDDKNKPAEPVLIVNTPLPVQGTVSATLSGTSPVSLSNTPTTPIFVDTDRSARNGFGATCSTPAVDPTFGQASCTLATVPAGREVVIETVSCSAYIAPGSVPDLQLIVPSPPLGGGAPLSLNHFLSLTRAGGNSTIEIWRFASPLRAYAVAPSGEMVDIGIFFRANPSTAVVENAICSISGYLVGQ